MTSLRCSPAEKDVGMTSNVLAIWSVWVVCGVLAYGICLNHFERMFPYFPGHLPIAIVMGALGPIGVCVGLIAADRPLGWRAFPIPLDEKRRLHKEKWPTIAVDF